MRQHQIPPWKKAPFIRLLFPFISGILFQWYIGLPLLLIIAGILLFSILFFLYRFFTIAGKFRLRIIQGAILQLVTCCIAMAVAWNADIRNHSTWFGHLYSDSMALIIRINEPLVEKGNSFKAEGNIEEIFSGDLFKPVHGKALIYFSKEFADTVGYGDLLLVSKPLQQIKNTGNPGAFNYERYAGFKGIFHSGFISESDYIKLPEKKINRFIQFIYDGREKIISILKEHLSDKNGIVGIAEALLIGYKGDLDSDLVQAYSNTGVVHIIAISGLHLGLIYFVLSWILGKIPGLRNNRHLNVVLILGSLWLFALLTGSSASVLRSAVMFSCILFGNTYFRRSSIYNSLAASAFILLCYDPYFLWDVGFQLSYLAVVGIAWLQLPIFRLFYIKNKWLAKIWNMMAVTIAAQIAAFPLCIYYFHQFPNLFLITNLFAVPLSTVILFAGIFLLCISWAEILAGYTGKLIDILISLMNEIIITFNGFPFAVMDNIYSTAFSTWLLYGVTVFLSAFLLYRKISWLRITLVCLVCFTAIHLFKAISITDRKGLIIYNIPKSRAIDIIEEDRFYFIGDSSVNMPGSLYNFHIKPARIALGLKYMSPFTLQNSFLNIKGVSILFLDSAASYKQREEKIPVDILVISKSPRLRLANLITAINPGVIVFDSSNTLWKIAEWKRECTMLLLRFHSVPEQGAFQFNIR